MVSPRAPRHLTESEVALLNAFLANDFPGADELRSQVAGATVVPGCTCGCGTIAFCQPTPLDEAARPAPIEGDVLDASGGIVGGLLLFVMPDGRLSQLEVYGFGENGLPLPAPSNVRWRPLQA